MIDPVVFSFGPFTVRWYALMITSAIVAGVIISLKESDYQGIDREFFLDFFLITLPVSLVGARLYYVIFHWQRYRTQPGRIIAVWEGGLAIHGGVIAGAIVLIIMVKKRGVNFWKTADILAPPLALGEAIGRWGNFFNQEAFGNIVSQEFISYFPEFIQQQMYIRGYYRNPAFLYASLWNLAIFLFLLWLRRRDFIIKGDVFLVYLLAYSTGRFFIEGIRVDSLMLGPFRVAQVLSVLLIIVSIYLIFRRHREEDIQ